MGKIQHIFVGSRLTFVILGQFFLADMSLSFKVQMAKWVFLRVTVNFEL